MLRDKLNQALYPDGGLLPAVGTLSGNANEAVSVAALLTHEAGGWLPGAGVIGDGSYGAAPRARR